MVSSAALFGAAFFESDVFAADTDVKVDRFPAWVGGKKPGRSDLHRCNTGFASFDAARDERFHADGCSNFRVLGPHENFLRNAGLQNAAAAHNDHLVSERQS